MAGTMLCLVYDAEINKENECQGTGIVVWHPETEQSKRILRSPKRMRAHVRALIIAVFAEALESGLVPLESQLLEEAEQALVSAKNPNYTLAAEIFRIKFTAIERLRGPCEITVDLRSKRGELLEAAGAGDDAIDAYKALATECRDVLQTLQPIDGGAVTSWMNAGVACRRYGRARDAERCYDEAVRLLNGVEPSRTRSMLHLNRIMLYNRCNLPGRDFKVKVAMCDLMSMPRRRVADIKAALVNGSSVAMVTTDGEEWSYKSGDDRPRRTPGVLVRWMAEDPGGQLGRASRAASHAAEAAGQVPEEAKRQVLEQCSQTAILNPCDGCGERRPVEEQKRCGGCRLASYCSVECQRSHWKAHKPQCRLAAAPAVGSDAAAPAGRRG